MERPLREKIQKVYIDKQAINSELAARAEQFFGLDKIEITDERPFSHLKGTLSAADFDRSKTLLWLSPFKGAFFKRCPGAKPGLACCNYFVLNLGLQCNMNCSYCYLQSYINTPVMTVYTNIDEALKQLSTVAQEYPDRYYRVGTGETTDSLSLDDFTLYSRKLISFFSQLPQWKLEFKSKSAKVDQFLDMEHAGNVLASWTLNPEPIIESEEHETASLHERLQAARKCCDRGHQITFHMDPLIWHADWKLNYGNLIDQIASMFKPTEVSYITVGALRFVPEQKLMMRERFGLKSHVVSGEMHPSSTGKLRYDHLLRSEMFSFVQGRFRSLSPGWRISLCMETPETWVTTMATGPRKIEELTDLFDPPQRAR